MSRSPKSTYFYRVVRDRLAPASGPFFTDVDGNVLLDFVSQVASAPFGYNDPEMIEFIRSLPIEDPDRYAGTDFICAAGKRPGKSSIPTPADLHEKIAKISRQLGMDCSYFSNSGAEAVENAMKICFLKNGKTKHFFSFDHAFHGRTIGALTLTRSKKVHRTGFPHLPYAESLPFCDCGSDCRCGWSVIGVDGKRHSALEGRIGDGIGMIDPNEVAFIIIEPVQGEGGYRIANRSFIREMVATAKDAKIPVIFDEIQSGLGRTGKWWAAEHYGVKPDVITAGKALRVAATIGRRDMFPDEEGKIAGTWCEGNAMATAVGYKTIEMIQQRNLLDNAQKMGRYLAQKLKGLEDRHLSRGRALGLMGAIDVDTHERRSSIIKKAHSKGLVIAPAGYRSIRLIPPLNVTKREIDLAIDILDRASR